MPAKPEIFISYAWGAPQEAIVDQLYASLQAKGYNIVRDKVNLGYKGNIKAFMERLGAGNAVIIVLSEKYLHSHNCMFEALQIKEKGNLDQRIFPIVLADANIYDILTRLSYCQYWDDKIEKLQKAIQNMSNLGNLQSAYDELNLYKEIRRFIDEFTDVVQNMNALTPDMHQNADFQQLIDALEALFAQDTQYNVNIPASEPRPAPLAPTEPAPDYTAVHNKVRNLIATAKLEEAIEVLGAGRPEFSDELTGLAQRLTEVKKAERRGLLDFRDAQRARNEITYSLLELMN